MEWTYHSTKKPMVTTGSSEPSNAKSLFFADWLVEKQTGVNVIADKDLEGVGVQLDLGWGWSL